MEDTIEAMNEWTALVQQQQEQKTRINDIFNRLESNYNENYHNALNAGEKDIRLNLRLPCKIYPSMWQDIAQKQSSEEWSCAKWDSPTQGYDIKEYRFARYSFSEEERTANSQYNHCVDILQVNQINDKFFAYAAFKVDLSQSRKYKDEVIDCQRSNMVEFDTIQTFALNTSKCTDEICTAYSDTYFSFDTLFPNLHYNQFRNTEINRTQLQTMLKGLNVPLETIKEICEPPQAAQKSNFERG